MSKIPTLTVTGHLHFNLILDSTMTFSSKLIICKMLCFQHMKKWEYFLFSVSCLNLLPIWCYKPKKNLTVHVLHACEVLLCVSDGIKYMGWGEKRSKHVWFVVLYFLLSWKYMCQQKYKCCIKDIKQWIKNSLTLKLVPSKEREIAINNYHKYWQCIYKL